MVRARLQVMRAARAPDLVLVNPGSRTAVYQALGSRLAAVEPPVWAGLMATFARQRGFAVEILDAEAEELTAEEAAARIALMRPRLAAVVVYGHQPSASTQNMTAAETLCAALKERAPAVPTLLVGGHAAALPERTLRETRADFVCGGEGPNTIVDLLAALGTASPDLGGVRGLWYRCGERVAATPPAPLVQDLDREMAGVAWDLLPMARYRAHNWHCFETLERAPYAALYTTLGCPYHCSFCCIQAPFKSGEGARGYKQTTNTYRRWHPDTVVAVIDRLVRDYGVRNLKIADEMFVLHLPHVVALCDRLIERNYGLNLWAYARVDTIRGAGTLEKLKRAGVNWLAFGIESASAAVRDGVDKRFTQEDIFRTLAAVRAAGINVIGNFIFGLPDDDLESMQQTLDLALELNCEFANFYCAMAYPGSPLYALALREGWPLPAQWSGYSQHAANTLPLPTRHLAARDVLRFRDHAFQVYFQSPHYLDMVTRKFGSATADHVRQMAAVPLVRQYA